MIGYALNAPTNISLRNLSAECKQPEMLCEMCLRDGKHVKASRVFGIKNNRYYAVCETHYLFLRITGGLTEQKEGE